MSYYGPRSGGHNRSNGDRRTGGGRSNRRGSDNRSFSSSNHRGYDDRRNNNNYGNYNMYQNSNQYSDPRTRDPQQQESPFKPRVADDDEVVSSVQPLSPEQQEHKKKQKLLKVTAENWDSCTFEEKVRSQFLMDHNAIFSMEGLTADEDTRYAKTLGEDWFAKKKEAARIAWEKVDEKIIAVSEKEFGKPRASDDYEDMDSDDSSAGCHRGLYADLHESEQQIVDEAEGVKPFIDALPYCVYLDQGFHYNGVSTAGDEMCYCPCSKKLKNWRDNFELTDNEKCDAKKKSPLGIMAHLRTLAEGERCFRHLGTLIYLKELYNNYWGTIKPGIDHKALYKQGEKNYAAAIQAENIEKNMAVDYWRTSYLEQQRMSKEWQKEIEKLKAANEDLSKKAEQLKNNNEKLGIATKRKKLKDYPSHEISAYKNQIHTCINVRKRLITKDGGELEFKTSQDVSFQRLFDGWYEDPSAKNDFACLFGDLDKKKQPLANAHKVVKNWDMQFDAGTGKSRREEDKALKAADDGGPSRAFYNAFFEQVGDMVIRFKVDNDTKNGSLMPAKEGFMVSCPEYGDGMIVEYNIKEEDDDRIKRENDGRALPVKSSILFETENELIILERNMFTITEISMNLFDKLSSKGALIPLRDVAFESMHAKYLQTFTNIELTNVTKKARSYYRAIGRFLAHVIFDDRNYTVSSLVLPSLLQNLFLRGIDPTSPLYKMEDLSPDLHQMDENFTLVKKAKNLTFADWMIDDDIIDSFYKGKVNENDELTKDNFRIFADLYTLKSRNIAIEALNEGINFVRPSEPNETAMFPPMLAMVPSVILSSVLFSCPKIDIEAIISVLHEVDHMYNINQVTEMISILHGQEPDKTYKFFVDILPIVLRRLAESDESFPANFLVYVTGSAFMPVLDIHSDYKILVGWEDTLNDDSIPCAHTCVNQINFPKTCYDSKDEGIGEIVLEERLKKMASFCREAGYGFV